MQERCHNINMLNLQIERQETLVSQDENIGYIGWKTHKLKTRRVKQAIRNTHENVQSTKEQQQVR